MMFLGEPIESYGREVLLHLAAYFAERHEMLKMPPEIRRTF